LARPTFSIPEAGEARCTACLLVDVDPVELVRGKPRAGGGLLDQYVNDRPYAASSFLSVAIGQVFSTALTRRCVARPEHGAWPARRWTITDRLESHRWWVRKSTWVPAP